MSPGRVAAQGFRKQLFWERLSTPFAIKREVVRIERQTSGPKRKARTKPSAPLHFNYLAYFAQPEQEAQQSVESQHAAVAPSPILRDRVQPLPSAQLLEKFPNRRMRQALGNGIPLRRLRGQRAKIRGMKPHSLRTCRCGHGLAIHQVQPMDTLAGPKGTDSCNHPGCKCKDYRPPKRRKKPIATISW